MWNNISNDEIKQLKKERRAFTDDPVKVFYSSDKVQITYNCASDLWSIIILSREKERV